jgi:MFS family permease
MDRGEIQVTRPEVMRRSIKGASIGNFMEWYDFGVYGYIATTIAQVFCPGNSVSAVHLIATFSTLAAAFVVRPLAGFIFGPLGDRIGRKRGLVITIVLMTIGTTVTGLLPGYSALLGPPGPTRVTGYPAAAQAPALARLTTAMLTLYFVLAVGAGVRARNRIVNAIPAASFLATYAVLSQRSLIRFKRGSARWRGWGARRRVYRHPSASLSASRPLAR